DVLVFHGSTDAPAVSVWETAVVNGELFSFSYGEFAGYLELPTLDFVLEIRDETGTEAIVSYSAPLSTLGLEGQALTVVASGFLNPANNSDGSGFGLFVALASGGALVELPIFTSIEESVEIGTMSFYPNPAKDQIAINYDLANSAEVKVEIFNLVGAKVYENNLGRQLSGLNNQVINLNEFKNGMYLLRLTANNYPLTTKFMINK
ncbi:MAG: T9SS type A sorting domain-containing protein, partial [Bacteroidetes bacterium]|nr:T9SS type A sorting domain-containing protein [Bacteroidota bacterium]MBU1578949.1 T9SS type A sorting domain-containing protein [Bacteroidota bacterium]MBU2557713.1 T9SS type A sorting domain-containing protein [Bacteroidota bacterium]